MVQAFLIVSWFAEHAFTLVLKMTGTMMLVPYLLVAAYGGAAGVEGRDLCWRSRASRRLDLVRGAIAALYAAGMIYAGGAKFLLLSALIYAPGTLLFVLARRERSEIVFTLAERALFVIVVVAAGIGLYGIATGSISV